MPDYEKLYLSLSNQVLNAMQILHNALQEGEEILSKGQMGELFPTDDTADSD